MKGDTKRRSAASGRFLLRIDPGLHTALRAAARADGVSLNDYCARKLAAPIGSLTALDDAARAVARAAQVVGEHLVGVAVFGSFARGEAADGSDVDLLVVVDHETRLTRALYHAWDEQPLEWSGRPVEAQFVQLPEAGEVRAGVWAEAALDGIVLFERSLELSTALVRTRHDIVAGRIVRRAAHGQSYWVRGVA